MNLNRKLVGLICLERILVNFVLADSAFSPFLENFHSILNLLPSCRSTLITTGLNVDFSFEFLNPTRLFSCDKYQLKSNNLNCTNTVIGSTCDLYSGKEIGNNAVTYLHGRTAKGDKSSGCDAFFFLITETHRGKKVQGKRKSPNGRYLYNGIDGPRAFFLLLFTSNIPQFPSFLPYKFGVHLPHSSLSFVILLSPRRTASLFFSKLKANSLYVKCNCHIKYLLKERFGVYFLGDIETSEKTPRLEFLSRWHYDIRNFSNQVK